MEPNRQDIRALRPRPQLTGLSPDSLRVAAPAKLNLTLLVGSARGDGFHPVDSVVAKVAFYDEVMLKRRRDGEVTFACRGIDCGPAGRNLAYRAAGILKRPTSAGADVHLAKTIPPGSGLGGGSSDAAAVLAGLNVLWELGLDAAELAAVGESLGSDVPLFLGPPCSRVTGRGETIEPAAVHDFAAVLILPKVPCATEEVYRAYDSLAAKQSAQVDLDVLANEPPSSWRRLLTNDLAAAARKVSPELDKTWRRLSEALSVPVCMTGAGGGLFVICDDEAEAKGVWASLPPELKAASVIVVANPW
jgi:4-diphosphocytidyl-2-C-methyl-D-erythritol kinase